jgi:hypothetical protein
MGRGGAGRPPQARASRPEAQRGPSRTARPAAAETTADRAPRSPATEMRRATTRAADARQQAKRDSR